MLVQKLISKLKIELNSTSMIRNTTNNDESSLLLLAKKTISSRITPSNKMCKAPLPMKKTRYIDSFETNINDFNRNINNTSLQNRRVGEVEEMKESVELDGSNSP